MKKQLIAKLLVLCMVVSMLPMTVFAAGTSAGVTNDIYNDVYNDGYKPGGDTSVSGGSNVADDATVSQPSTSGDATTVEVAVENKTSGSTATATVSKTDMDKAVSAAVEAAAAAKTAPVVVIKIKTSGRTNAVKANLPTGSLKALSEVKGAALSITSNVMDMVLDSDCLATLAAQGSDTVAVSMQPTEPAALNSAQKEAVKGATVIDVSITSGNKQITRFGGGTLSISVAYTLPSGVTEASVQVYYLNNKGILQSHETSYSGGKVTFKTTHLSKYVIGTKDLLGVNFTDVAFGQWYYDAVAWASKNKITSGTTTTTFSPANDCSRAEIVTFLWRSANSPEPASTNNPFTDVNSSDWYYKAVLWAVEKGITSGTTTTTFSPDKVCSRAEAVTFLHRSENKPTASGVSFTDVPAGAWYSDAVAWAAANEITSGTTTTTFSPENNCSRAEIVTFMFRNVL